MTGKPPAKDDGDSGVLRPYVEPTHDPLPPVESPPLGSAADSTPLAPPPPPPVDADTPAPPVPSAAAEGRPIEAEEPLAEWIPPVPAGAPPGQESKPGTISVSRKLIGVLALVVLGVVSGLAYLWQTSGSDSSATSSADVETPIAVPTTVAGESPDQDSATSTEPPTPTSAVTKDDLEAQIEDLESQLAAMPAPALPGLSLQRIVVSAEASFVSASDTSVAVVGPFGNFANIDPATNAVVAAGQVALGATRVIRTATSVWITDYSDSKLIWINPATNIVNQTFDFPGPDGLAKDGKSLVVSSFDNGLVARFDPAVGKIVEQVGVGGNPTAIAVGDQGGIWAAIFNTGELVRIDPATFTISDRIPVGAGPVGIALSPGTVWVANHDEGTIAEVSIAERKVISTIDVGEGPTELLVDSGSLWVAVTGAGDLLQIDVATGKIVTRTPLGGVARGGGPTGISAGAGSIWVAIEGEQSVVRVTLPS